MGATSCSICAGENFAVCAAAGVVAPGVLGRGQSERVDVGHAGQPRDHVEPLARDVRTPAHGVDRGAPRTAPGPPGATDRAISPTPATRPGPRPPRPDETGRRPALLSRRNRPPGPRAARAPGGRFELVATVEAGGIEPPLRKAEKLRPYGTLRADMVLGR